MARAEVRNPAVAGMFYEGGQSALKRQIEECYTEPRGPGAVPAVNDAGPRRILGFVSPHAGYMYSGPGVAKGFARLAEDGRPEAFVIIGPNHGRGQLVGAIQTAGSWVTPLGASPIATEIASTVAGRCPSLQPGAMGFTGEHSIEVQLPFIQHLYGTETPIVPIMMLDQSLAEAQDVGEALAAALEGRNAVIVASTDMTHFETAARAGEQDAVLIQRIESLDPEGLLRERQARRITMCGYGPVAAMLIAAKALGATTAKRVEYTNSGAVGDRSEVVAYLTMTVEKE